MAEQTIESGETVTVASGETFEAGPLNLDGTLVLDGTANVGEQSLQASARAGAVTGRGLGLAPLGSMPLGGSAPMLSSEQVISVVAAAEAGAAAQPTPSSEKAVIALAEGGATAQPVTSKSKAVLAAADAGVDGLPLVSKDKAIRGGADAGATAVPVIDWFVPLMRTNNLGIDNSRRDDFDTQAAGDVDD